MREELRKRIALSLMLMQREIEQGNEHMSGFYGRILARHALYFMDQWPEIF